ncbi:unnamed protein product [Sphagnum jensenii]|uniref:Pectate lyase n=1 Tax=Sphagnum jensenii TaxID=128206 RepID=A0ABP1AWS0_9BRYO
MCDPQWESHRQTLANCAIGFGKNAIGGKNGRIYVVTSNSDDNVENPVPGTLRYAASRNEPLWIIFANSMTIHLNQELFVTSYKTIDGRGATVIITGGASLSMVSVNNVIIHGLYIHNIVSTGPASIITSQSLVEQHGVADGDAIHIQTSNNIWVDHCFLAKAADGLIDCTDYSNLITISNNYFTAHDKVMLFGSHPNQVGDRNMHITVAFNKFGPGLVQRMPRVRFGYVQVLNNDYTSGWGIYAIGGSEDPTILSQGNVFNPANGNKEVTKRVNDGGGTYGGWQSWNWNSAGDVFLNGAYFVNSGAQEQTASVYAQAISVAPLSGQRTPAITFAAGPLN